MDATDVVHEAPERQEPRGDGSRGIGVLAVLLSGVVSVAFGPLAVWLIRDQLHIGCGTYPAGTEGAGTWTCADGIGYVSLAAVLGAMWLLTVVLGSLIAGGVRDERRSRMGLWLLGLAITGSVLGWFWSTTLTLVRDENSALTAEQLWLAAIGPAALVAAVALVVAGVSLFLRGRAPFVLAVSAAVIMTVAIALQPGLGLNLLPVVGLLAALAARSQRPRRTPVAQPT